MCNQALNKTERYQDYIILDKKLKKTKLMVKVAALYDTLCNQNLQL